MGNERFYLTEFDRFPALSSLAALADACAKEDNLGKLTSECRTTFDRFLNSGELSAVVTTALRAFADGQAAHPNWLSRIAEEWIILDTKDYSLRLVATKPKKAPLLQSLNFNCLIGNPAGVEYVIDLHRFPSGVTMDEFKSGVEATFNERIALTKGQSCELLATEHIPSVKLSAPSLTLTLYPKVYAPIIWCFDKVTLLSVMAMASHDSPVRRQAGAEMLRHILLSEDISVQASMETLQVLTRDDSHFVRWSAIQSLCAIDFNASRPYLIRAAQDPHPAVAASARRAIAAHVN